MSSNNEITLVRSSSGELIESGTTNLEQIENKLSEIEANLTTLADQSGDAIVDLVALAKASQNPLYYEVLSKLLNAAAKVNHEAVVAVVAKSQLHQNNSQNNKPAGVGDEANPGHTTVNNLIMTSTDLLDHILNKNKNNGPE